MPGSEVYIAQHCTATAHTATSTQTSTQNHTDYRTKVLTHTYSVAVFVLEVPSVDGAVSGGVGWHRTFRGFNSQSLYLKNTCTHTIRCLFSHSNHNVLL